MSKESERVFLCLIAHYLVITRVMLAANVFPKRIPIGAVLNEHMDAQSRVMFTNEIEKFNNASNGLFKIDRYEKILTVQNSYRVTKAVCSALSKGVFSLIGIENSMLLDTLASYSRTFHMPYITTSEPRVTAESDYTIYLRPPYHKPIIRLAVFYEWKKFYYLYDNELGLQRLTYMHHLMRTNNSIPYLKIEPVWLPSTENCYNELRLVDSKQEHEDKKCIVLDLSTEAAFESVLLQIQNMGMHREGYHYILGGLIMDSIDLNNFKYGGANFTGLQLADPDSVLLQSARRDWIQISGNSHQHHQVIRYSDALHHPPSKIINRISLEAMLTIDAVSVVTRALTTLLLEDPEAFKGTFRRGEVYNNDSRGIQCKPMGSERIVPWVHGPEIIKHLKRVRLQGLTGRIMFDEKGHRKEYRIDVMEMKFNTLPRRVGSWNDTEELVMDRSIIKEDLGSDKNLTLRVTTIRSSPFLMLKEKPDDGVELQGNERFEGFVPDLALMLSQTLDFKYKLVEVADGKYGARVNDTHWNGMIGELMRKEADLAIAPLTISSLRERVIDFTKPFMDLGISIMIRKPEKQKPGIFSFLDPLSTEVWMCIVLAYFTVSFVLFLVNRFSPSMWHVQDSGGSGVAVDSNEFTLLNSLWFTLGAFMQQGCDISPRTASGRVAGSAWWFFVLILISTYTANLAAFLTVERMLTPINSADDLAKQTEILYGTIDSGSSKTFFETAKVDTYKRMWDFMKVHPDVFMKTTELGVERVRSSKGKYAFILESTMNDFYNQRKPCNTMKVGQNLDSKGYGVATPIDSDLRDQLGLAVLQLRESGELQKLQKKWWYDKGECYDTESKGSITSALTLNNVAGIFYILVGGLGLSMLVSFTEYLCRKRKSQSIKKERSSRWVNIRTCMTNSSNSAPLDRRKSKTTSQNSDDHSNSTCNVNDIHSRNNSNCVHYYSDLS